MPRVDNARHMNKLHQPGPELFQQLIADALDPMRIFSCGYTRLQFDRLGDAPDELKLPDELFDEVVIHFCSREDPEDLPELVDDIAVHRNLVDATGEHVNLGFDFQIDIVSILVVRAAFVLDRRIQQAALVCGQEHILVLPGVEASEPEKNFHVVLLGVNSSDVSGRYALERIELH